MSKLIAPSDLDCFATCDHAGPCANHEQAAAAEHWCVPEAWQACAQCRDLIKARLITSASATEAGTSTLAVDSAEQSSR